MGQSLANAVNNVFNLYFFILILRIFLTWIPSIRWEDQPWRTIREISDVYLNLFRRIIPPINGLDFSPIVALILLQIVQQLIVFALIKIM